MIIYFALLAVLFVFSLKNSDDKFVQNSIGIIVGLFLCTTYFNGSDWRQYELMYNNVDMDNLFYISREFGFSVYMLIFKNLGVEFFHFFISTKIIIFYIFYKTILRYAYRDNKYFILSYFYVTMGLYLFIDCPLRNLIAIGISLIAMKQLENKRRLLFFILLLIAASFHKTAYVMLLLPVILKYRVKI